MFDEMQDSSKNIYEWMCKHQFIDIQCEDICTCTEYMEMQLHSYSKAICALYTIPEVLFHFFPKNM